MSKVCLCKKKLRKVVFGEVFQHLRRKLWCRHHYGTFKCKSFVGKYCKKQPLSKSYLPTKVLYFKSFSILEEKCGAYIINGTFKCKTFVGKCCKKRSLSRLYLLTKALFFQDDQSFSILEKNCTVSGYRKGSKIESHKIF